MKKLLTSYFLLLTSVMFSQAVPNAGFESWSGGSPNSWASLNVFTAVGGPASVFQTTVAYSGTYACKMVTADYKGTTYYPSTLQDTASLCGVGTISIANQSFSYGFTFTSKPAYLDFYAKYTPNGTDTAWVVTWLQKRTGSVVDTIAYAAWPITAQATYTFQHVPLIYNIAMNGISPDTAAIVLSASGDVKPKKGSIFYADDFAFTGTSTSGIVDAGKSKETIRVFPNPTSDRVVVNTLSADAREVLIYNITGALVGTYPILNNEASINVKNFPAGLYIYSVAGNKNNALGVGKFTVER